jgi:hypothetical protein
MRRLSGGDLAMSYITAKTNIITTSFAMRCGIDEGASFLSTSTDAE